MQDSVRAHGLRCSVPTQPAHPQHLAQSPTQYFRSALSHHSQDSTWGISFIFFFPSLGRLKPHLTYSREPRPLAICDNLVSHRRAHRGSHIPRAQVQETPTVFCYVLAPGLRPNHVEEACVTTQLLPEHWPESGLGTQDFQPPNSSVNATLQ
jgi:hypothetical protein